VQQALGTSNKTRNLKGPAKVALELMTCRIERVVTGENLVVLCISGQITDEHVDTFRAALEQEAKTVAVNLKDVLLVNHEAVRLLAFAEANGAELQNCPAYVREWVARERAQKDGVKVEVRDRSRGKSDDGV